MSKFVFDLDGTICTQQKSGEYEKAQPIDEVISRMKALKDDGHYIIIFTARGMNTYGHVSLVEAAYKKMTIEWLRKHDVPYDNLVFGKPAADFYVDDKGMTPKKFIERYDKE